MNNLSKGEQKNLKKLIKSRKPENNNQKHRTVKKNRLEF